MLRCGEALLFDVSDVLGHGARDDLGHVAVFLDEFGCKSLELAHKIGNDQQLAVRVRSGADAVYGDVQLIPDDFTYFRRHGLDQDGKSAGIPDGTSNTLMVVEAGDEAAVESTETAEASSEPADDSKKKTKQTTPHNQ